MEKFDQLIKLFNEQETEKCLNGLKLKNLPDCLIPATPVDFLFNFFTDWNFKYSTYDKDGVLITGISKRRSIQESYYLTKSYFPEYTVENYFFDLFKVFYRIHKETDCILLMGFCNDIKRTQFLYCRKAQYPTYLDIKTLDIFPVSFTWRNTACKFTKILSDPELLTYLTKEITNGKV